MEITSTLPDLTAKIPYLGCKSLQKPIDRAQVLFPLTSRVKQITNDESAGTVRTVTAKGALLMVFI